MTKQDLVDIGVGLKKAMELLGGDLSYDKRARAKKMLDGLINQVSVLIAKSSIQKKEDEAIFSALVKNDSQPMWFSPIHTPQHWKISSARRGTVSEIQEGEEVLVPTFEPSGETVVMPQ